MEKQSISKKYNKNFEIFVYSGTLAIETVLINENIKKGDIVLIPNNVCYRILTAIIRTGATPLIVKPKNDLILTEKDLKTALEKYNVKAILAVHQFGLNVNIHEIRKICNNNEIIIEDIAQGWDVRSNTKLGIDSDYIITSMGKDKPLDFGMGGVVLTNNELYKNMDCNNIKSRYSDNSKLIPFVLPANIKINIKKLMKKAYRKKNNNVKYARICTENIKNEKIEFYKVNKVEDCYWERFPIWTEDEKVFDYLISLAKKLKIQYEPSHEKLLEELPLTIKNKSIFLNLSNHKRYFIFLKTKYYNKKKLKKYAKEINKI